MGSAAIATILFVLAAGNVVLAILWRSSVGDARIKWNSLSSEYQIILSKLSNANTTISAQEAEILRLRKIPLTESKSATDNAVIHAKSPAQVRQITEAAWSQQTEENYGA